MLRTPWVRRALFGAFLAAVMSLGAFAFSAVDRRFVHVDVYAKDRATDSLRTAAQVERGNLKDSIINAKLDEALLRLQQIKCGDSIKEGCR